MRYCVYGLGAVGGLIAGRLSLAGEKVSAVARGRTLEAVQQEGLKLVCSDPQVGTEIATVQLAENAGELGEQDVVFIAVKSTSIASVAAGIAPLLHKETVVVSAMNGVPWWFCDGLGEPAASVRIDSIDPGALVSQAIETRRVVGCVAHLSSSTPSPGVVHYKAGPRFILGEPTGGFASQRCDGILSAFRRAGLKADGADSIQEAIWFKLWGNMTLNPISAMTGATADKVIADPLVLTFMKACMEEGKEIGTRLGLRVQASVEDRVSATAALGAFQPSMLQDVLANRPLELDALVAAVRQIAVDLGVPSPSLDALFGLSRLFAQERGLYR